MSTSLTKILLATDGSEDAALAGRAAADLSNKTAADLHVVHVWTDVPPTVYRDVSLNNYSRLAKGEAMRLLRREAWNARIAGGRVAGQHLREGQPAEEIIAIAEELDADLVVVGSRRVGRVKRLITGSVSEGVVHRASCPVLVVCGGEGAWPVGRVVVADDGSGPARRAGDLAAGIANLSGAEVVVVRAYEHPPEPVGGWSAQDRRELDEALLRNRRDLKKHGLPRRYGPFPRRLTGHRTRTLPSPLARLSRRSRRPDDFPRPRRRRPNRPAGRVRAAGGAAAEVRRALSPGEVALG